MGFYALNMYSRQPIGKVRVRLDWSSAIYGDTLDESNRLQSISEIEIGCDDDDEILFKPGEVDIELSVWETNTKWRNLLLEISTLDVNFQVQLDGSTIFQGKVFSKSVEGEKTNRTISLKGVDAWQQLKDIDPRTNPLSYTLSNYARYDEIILDLLTTAVGSSFVQSVVNLSTYETQVDTGSLQTVPITDFGCQYDLYFASNSYFDNCADLIKGILTTFGNIGYIGLDRKFYIIPRVHQGTTPVTIPDSELSEETPTEIVRKMLGVKAYVFTGSPGTYQTSLSGSDSDEERLQVLRIHECAGALPVSGSATNLACYYSGSWYWSEMDAVRRLESDGVTYTSRKSNWLLTKSDAWGLIQNDRFLFRPRVKAALSKVGGKSALLDDYIVGKYYSSPLLSSNVLRARLVAYDLQENEAELELLE